MRRLERFFLFLFLLFSYFPVSFGGLTFLKIFGALFAGVAGVSILNQNFGNRGVFDKVGVAVLVTLLAGFLGALSFGYVDSFSLTKMLLNLILLISVIHVVRHVHDLRFIFFGLISGGLLTIATGIMERRSVGEGGRVAGIMLNPNGFGQVCIQVGICILVLIALARTRRRKILLSFLLIAPFFGLVFSASRGASIALIMALAVSFGLHRGLRRASISVAVLGIAVLLIVGDNNPLMRRWDRVDQAKVGGTSALEVRLGLAKNGIRIFEEYPVFGVGIGNVPRAVRVSPDMFLHGVTHNFFTQVLAETGFVGAIAFLAALYWSALFLFRFTNHKWKYEKERVLGGGLLVLFVAVLVGSSISGNYLHPIWYVIIGAVAGLRLEERSHFRGRNHRQLRLQQKQFQRGYQV